MGTACLCGRRYGGTVGWDVVKANSLSATAYPDCSATLTLPASKPFQYKYIRKDESGKALWESGDNRTATASSTCSQILNDTWR